MKKLIFCLLLSLFSTATWGRLIQILYVNDLHSFFEGTRDGMGGYARLKTLADQLKQKAKVKGIETLFLNSGDFAEGSSFYFSDKGVDSLKALDLLGIDISVLGNHDFMLGPQELKRQLQEANLQSKLLSANLHRKNILSSYVQSYVDKDLEGAKLRIAGLTTSEIIYQYPLVPETFISPSHRVGIMMANRALADKVDFLIMLTHIGLKKDILLAHNTHSIDLIIGGHSHDLLEKPYLVKNLKDETVPIFQAGAHSNYLGEIIIDVLKNGQSRILSFKMHEVTKEIHEDPQLKSFVEEAKIKRAQYFGRQWNEVIGFSEIPLSGDNGALREKRTCWSRHIARLTRTKAETEIGIQVDLLQGERIPAGPITFGDVIDNFPHFRNWGDQGWKISRFYVSGFLLKQILNAMARSQMSDRVTVDGLHANYQGEILPFDVMRDRSDEALVHRLPINNMRFYSVALPSEVPYAITRMLGFLGHLVLRNLETVEGSDYWPLYENYIAQNSPVKCLED